MLFDFNKFFELLIIYSAIGFWISVIYIYLKILNKKHVKEMNEMIIQGKAMEAFEKFYADDVTMQENSEETRIGKDVNREFEKKFMESIEEFHGMKLNATAFSDDGEIAMNYWDMDVTFKGAPRKKSSQVSVQKWKDGKIVKERFFYK